MRFFLFLHQEYEIIHNDMHSLNIWIPMYNEIGNSPHYYRRAKDVVKDDILFHYKRGYIRGVSVVEKNSISVDQSLPLGLPEELGILGFYLKMTYYTLEQPIRIRDYLKDILMRLPERFVAFQPTGNSNEGSLYPCPYSLADFLLQLINPIDQNQATSTITEIVQSIKARIGQQKYREKQLKLWNSKCALCEINHTDFLRASHAKPWKVCNSNERLNPFNGLLLCVLHDTMFDQGYITFSSTGQIQISSEIIAGEYTQYKLIPNQQISLSQKHEPYMTYHRENIFRY